MNFRHNVTCAFTSERGPFGVDEVFGPNERRQTRNFFGGVLGFIGW
ncbi:hypothetical protein [Lentzea nigeriaca]|nr:hypothetical protein [Lentzea nigeriaca]MBM7857008.1 hypothetical protein [Lentzea nigeriaca]